MAQNNNITLPPGTWTQLTNGDVTALRVQNLSSFDVLIMGTVGAVTPTSLLGAITLNAGSIIAADMTLANLFPGVAGANRVYGFCAGPNNVFVSVSHA